MLKDGFSDEKKMDENSIIPDFWCLNHVMDMRPFKTR